jgi:hypothetical protein
LRESLGHKEEGGIKSPSSLLKRKLSIRRNLLCNASCGLFCGKRGKKFHSKKSCCYHLEQDKGDV